jgi:hypothetical protein
LYSSPPPAHSGAWPTEQGGRLRGQHAKPDYFYRMVYFFKHWQLLSWQSNYPSLWNYWTSWLKHQMLLICAWEMLSSNFGQDIEYPDLGLSWVSSAAPLILSRYISTNEPTIWHHTFLVTDSVVK